MYNVNLIKKQKIVGLITGVSAFLLTLICDSYASTCRNSIQYYWSSDVKAGATIFSVFSLFLGLLSAVMLGSSIFMFYLDKNGKVCPECKMIYPKSSAKCLRCNNDITYAKSIAEYRAESSVENKGTLTSDTKISCSDVQNNVLNASCKKFCPFCGQKMRGTDRFCTSCGKKN